jgi:hypothetical protein
MDPEMPKPGRPKKYGRAALAFMLRTRILREEHVRWKRAAKAAGKSLSEFLRDTMNAATPPG